MFSYFLREGFLVTLADAKPGELRKCDRPQLDHAGSRRASWRELFSRRKPSILRMVWWSRFACFWVAAKGHSLHQTMVTWRGEKLLFVIGGGA